MGSVARAEFVIPGEPVQWARAGKHGKRHFTKPAQHAHMLTIERAWMAADRPYLGSGAIALSAQFWLPRPAAHFGTGRNAGTLKPSAPEHPLGPPDTSNYLKLLEDALNERLWDDDAQITCLSGVHKLYARRPQDVRTVITAWAAREPR